MAQPASTSNGGTATFLRNAWYVAALAADLGDGLLARTICKQPVVLFRGADGRPIALEDRCCHRGLPLSMGKIVGGHVQCGYHGLEFDTSGTCIAVPGQSIVPPGARVAAFPVVERDAFIWIWMGDPTHADPDTIPDYHWNTDPDWTTVGGSAEVDCHYMLSIDNLMDLTHEIYIHQSTLAADAITENPIKTMRTDDYVSIERWMIDTDPGALWVKALWGDEAPVPRRADRWQIVTYFPPSHTLLDIGVAPTGTGAPQGNRVGTAEARLAITLTPVDETTSVYYWVFPYNFARGDTAMSDWLQKAINSAYAEDFVALEAQQRAMLGQENPWKVDVNADAGQLAARRLHDRRITEEQAGRTADAAE